MNARSCLPPWWPRPGNATARNSSASVCQSLVFLTRGTFSFCFLIWPWRAQHKDWNEQWTNHINSQSKSLRRLSKADTCTSFFFFLEGTLVPWVGFSPRKHLKSQQNVHFFVPHVKPEKKTQKGRTPSLWRYSTKVKPTRVWISCYLNICNMIHVSCR